MNTINMTIHSIDQIIFKFKNKLRRSILSFFKLRPASYPYITGDGFRKMADNIYDESQKCKPEDVKYGYIVFVRSDMIEEWFESIHPKINYKYKLITHNSDYNVKESDLKYIDDKIIHWFAQNVITKHPKLTSIPIGIDNLFWSDNGLPSLFDIYNKIKINKKNRILFGFSINTNPKERQPAYDFLINSGICDKLRWINNPKEYLENINKYKFIACPNGNGLDDPRRWQALYLNIVPIVTKSEAMDYFKRLGLPFYIINDWRELSKFQEKDLEKVYNEIVLNKNTEPSYFSYWKEKIIRTN